jgi:hypothetical protein
MRGLHRHKPPCGISLQDILCPAAARRLRCGEHNEQGLGLLIPRTEVRDSLWNYVITYAPSAYPGVW